MALVLWLERRKMVEMAKNDPNFHVFLNKEPIRKCCFLACWGTFCAQKVLRGPKGCSPRFRDCVKNADHIVIFLNFV